MARDSNRPSRSSEGEPEATPAPEAQTKPSSRVLFGPTFRLILAPLWLVLIAIFNPDHPMGWVMMGTYFLLALVEVILGRTGKLLQLRAVLGLLMDVAAITTPIYGFGSQTSGFPLMYSAPIIVHTLLRGPWMGLLALVLSASVFDAVVLLEWWGTIPPAPFLHELNGPITSPLGPAFVIAVTTIGLSAIYGFVAFVKSRFDRHLETERTLIASERAAHEHSRSLQQQLELNARLEAIGRLAGGIAHDFNNILTGILGFARLARDELGPGTVARADVDEIVTASEKAAQMTNELLAFSRQQVVSTKVIDLNDKLTELKRMLERLLGDQVELELRPSDQSCFVKADPTQIERVLVNLVVNARDAMPDGGTLSITTGVTTLTEMLEPPFRVLDPGDYALLTVTDNGEGISPDDLPKIFEPFFTTKQGDTKGTGLGLATVYGIVSQAGGALSVESTPGQGTSFSIHLPLTTDAPLASVEPPNPQPHKGSEKVMIVEDEAIVRRVITRLLEREGYDVLVASNGVEALDQLEAEEQPIQLLLTDVVMPEMNGRELAKEVYHRWGPLPVIFMSGYTEEHPLPLDGDAAGGRALFLEKPFTHSKLLSTIRKILEPPAAA